MRIMVVDDHVMVRDGISSLLESAGNTIVAQCGDGETAIQQAVDLQPDVVLMDINMPGLNGMAALNEIKSQAPQIKVVMLTISEEEQRLVQAIQHGADGYMLKSASGDELLGSLKALEDGDLALTSSMATRVIHGLILNQSQSGPCLQSLTEREIEILKLVAEGHPNRVIGENINVSENTVKYHIKKILQKLNAHNRTEAVSIGMRLGLIKRDGADN